MLDATDAAELTGAAELAGLLVEDAVTAVEDDDRVLLGAGVSVPPLPPQALSSRAIQQAPSK